MSDRSGLRPATPEEIAEALSFALRFKGRRPFTQSNTLMAGNHGPRISLSICCAADFSS